MSPHLNVTRTSLQKPYYPENIYEFKHDVYDEHSKRMYLFGQGGGLENAGVDKAWKVLILFRYQRTEEA